MSYTKHNFKQGARVHAFQLNEMDAQIATTASKNVIMMPTTDAAKATLRETLGIAHTLTVTVVTQNSVTVTGQTVYVHANNAEGEVYASAAYNGQPVSFSLPSGFTYYVRVSDTLPGHYNPSTATGIIADADAAATLTYNSIADINSASDIKAALNANIDLTDLVGEQITCMRNGSELIWDVVDYDEINKNVTLLLHDAFGTDNMIFEPTQAFMYCEDGLAAGDYKFSWNNIYYYLTLTIAIPTGGQLYFSTITSNAPTVFQTFASQESTTVLESGNVGTTAIEGAINLGTNGTGLLNEWHRATYGSNNYAESALRWWLNTDSPAGTQRPLTTKFCRPYSYTQPGFLYNLDSDFLDCLDEVDWKCSTNDVYECPQSLGGYTSGTRQTYTVKDKIGLASGVEIFGTSGGTEDGSVVYDLYNGATATDRIKYRNNTAVVWWLRSPSWNTAYYEWSVSSSGYAYSNLASSSCAVVPACQISQDAAD